MTNNGYININMGQTEIIMNTRTLLHIINTNEIKTAVQRIEENLVNLGIETDEIIRKEMDSVKEKIKAIEPKIREKRGLVNLVGNVQKYLFGTMDEDDRKEILNHLEIIDKNEEQEIENLNKQIQINSALNESIVVLKNIIESDRNKILKTYQQTSENEKRLIQTQLKLDQLIKIEMLKEKVNQIIDNIALVRHGIIHPSMLTTTEIEMTGLDFYKLKNARTGMLRRDKDTIILAVKIPSSYKILNYQIVIPMTTANFKEIKIPDQYIITINQTKYEYTGQSQYEKELKPINNCITENNCELVENKETEIRKLDENTIICKNLKNEKIVNLCDNRKINLNGNVMLIINNCTIKIRNQTFSSNDEKFVDRFFFVEENEWKFKNKMKFEEILIKNIENLDHIKQIKVDRKINYVSNVTIVIILLIMFSIILNF